MSLSYLLGNLSFFFFVSERARVTTKCPAPFEPFNEHAAKHDEIERREDSPRAACHGDAVAIPPAL